MRRRTYVTRNPKLYCPECKNWLRITSLSHKLWCEKCFKYIPEESLINKFVKGFE